MNETVAVIRKISKMDNKRNLSWYCNIFQPVLQCLPMKWRATQKKKQLMNISLVRCSKSYRSHENQKSKRSHNLVWMIEKKAMSKIMNLSLLLVALDYSRSYLKVIFNRKFSAGKNLNAKLCTVLHGNWSISLFHKEEMNALQLRVRER